MKFLILLIGLLIFNSTSAQDSWKVSHNGKTILTTNVESSEKNVIEINKNELKKKSYICVIYKEAVKQRDWNRSIIIFDEKDNQLYKKENFTVKLENAVLAVLFKRSKVLNIYTTSLPKDPKLAAAVRIRRVHLATIRMI
jgi:hypothetical protein